MRVAVVHSFMGFLMGGGERLVEEVGGRLEERGYDVHYITLNYRKERTFRGVSKVCWRRTRVGFLPLLRSYLWNLSTLLACLKCIKSLNPHLLIFSTNHPIAGIVKLLTKRKIILYVHWPEFLQRGRGGVLKRIYNALIDVLELWSLRSSDYLFTNSGYTLRVLRRVLPGVAGEVAYPGVDTGFFKPLNKNPYLVLTVSRIHPAKNLEFVLRVAQRVKGRNPRARFIVSGFLSKSDAGYLDKLIKYGEEIGVGDLVEFHVNPSDEELARLYGEASILLYPRVGEHFGIALVEGMSAKDVCLAMDVGGPQEIIDDGVDGFRLPPDEDVWAEKIATLLENPELMERIGERAREKAVREFSWDAMADKFERAFRRAMRN